MNAHHFFNQGFARHLVEEVASPVAWANRALSASHDYESGAKSRLTSGWAIVRPAPLRSSMQLRLRTTAFDYEALTRFVAFRRELDNWDGEPRIFLLFDKAPISAANLFLTVDTRAVRICGVGGVETFDFTRTPSDGAGVVERNIKKGAEG